MAVIQQKVVCILVRFLKERIRVFFPLETLPEYIQPFAELLPLSLVADGMRSIASDGMQLIDVYSNFIGIGVWILIGTLISTKLFVWKEVAG